MACCSRRKVELALKPALLRRLKRPFSNAHWLLLAALIVVWEVALWAQQCNEPPYYFEVILATSTICISLWVSHLRVAPLDSFGDGVKIIAGAIYDLILFVLLWVLIGLPIAVVMPTYQCYTPRAKVSEVIVSAYSIREQIESRAMQAQSLNGAGVGLHVELNHRTKSEFVTNDGIIIVASDDPPAVVILQPAIVEGKIKWKCSGFPATIMPASCR